MKTCTKLRAIALALFLAFVAAFCGFFMTACDKDNGGGDNGDNSNVNAPESKPLSLTSSVVTNDSGENVYTINAIVNPDTLTPRWAIVWENADSEWASGKNVNDYISLELSNGDKTAQISTKQAFGETAILTATIGQGASAVSVSKRVDYSAKLIYELNEDASGYVVVGCSDIFSVGFGDCVIPSLYLGKPVVSIANSDVGASLLTPLFTDAAGIKNLVIGENVELVSPSAFRSCTLLESVEYLGRGTLALYAFYGCSSLKSVKLSEGLVSISSSCFEGCTALEKIIIPNSVTKLGTSVFHGCISLYDISLPNGINQISSYVFRDCVSLESIIIPSGVSKIAVYAFLNCSSLKNVTFMGDKSKVDISSGAFEGCPFQL